MIREIKDEIYVRGGRINLVELAKEVNVDLGVVNSKAHEICNSDKRIRLILGQLIDETYVVKIAKEINEKLIQVGQINVSDLTSTYDLPAEFLQQSVLEKYLGKLIFARQDPENSQIFFTEAFVSRSRAKIRGALAAITRPTPITAIINQCDISDRLFFTFMKEISLSGTLTSKQTSAQYIPFAYSKIQVEMVLNSHKQNGYLEYDSLVNLGITDPKPFIKRVLPNEELIFLKSCAISNQLIEQVNTLIEECHQSKSFVDVSSFLPSVLSQGDTDDIIKKAITPALQKTLQVFGSTGNNLTLLNFISNIVAVD